MEQKREMVAKIWIHAKCASEEDERLEPIFYSKEQSCQYCGVYGKVFLYEKGSERVLVADESGNLIGERERENPFPFEENIGGSISLEMLVEEREVAESIPVDARTAILMARPAEEAEILSEIDDSIEELAQEIVQEQEATAEVVEETVAESGEGETEAETATEHNDAVDNTTLTRLEQMKEQVAELERQIEENSTE